MNKQANSAGARQEIDTLFKIDEVNSSGEEECLDLSTDHLPPLLAHCLKKHAQQYPLGGYIPIQKIKVEINE